MKVRRCERVRNRKWIAAVLLAAVLLTLPGCAGFMRSSPDPTPIPEPTLSPEEIEAIRRAEEEERAAKELEENTEKYSEAKELLYTRQFYEAYSMFTELGDFSDSAELAAYTKSYHESEPEYGDRAIDDAYLAKEFPEGKLYSLSDYGGAHGIYRRFKGMLYVPDEVNTETAFVQYYGGGGHEEDYLWYEGVYSYFDTYFPNAIIVFTNESGTTHISERNAFQWDVLRQVAYECGTVVHDLSTIASSNGCYTAMQLCYDYYVNHGIRVKRFVALDTGMYWTLDYLALTAEQCAVVAEAGTEFHLFEEEAFCSDLGKPAMQNILKSDIKATAYICRNNGHSVISQNGYALGLFSFCAGEDVEPPAFEYYKVELYDGIESFGEISWPPKPESDTRKVW